MADPDDDENKESFISHLVELRDRLLRCLLVMLILILAMAPFANHLYEIFAHPLMSVLPKGDTMIATQPHAPFFVPLKLVIFLGVIASMPYILYQIWAFVAPGLYENEKTLAVPLLVSSTVLFYLGILFAYFVVFPLIFSFFTRVAPPGVAVMTDIDAYLNFCMKLFFAFGACFEVPVATVILVKIGIITPDALAQKRPYIVVGAFVVGMLMTPPDIFSQTMLALPIWALFEAGLWFSRRVERRSVSEEPEGGDAESDPAGSND